MQKVTKKSRLRSLSRRAKEQCSFEPACAQARPFKIAAAPARSKLYWSFAVIFFFSKLKSL
jgi:hypothetical protein